MENFSMKQYALSYAKIGFAVFPLRPQSKLPATRNGLHDATTDIKKIENWWTQNPQYNIGMCTGAVSGNRFVIDFDIDNDKGIDGWHNFQDWCRERNYTLPETVSAITGRGGYHYFFHSSIPINGRVGVIEGVDVRGDGGYIVAPPSVHPNGNRYEWEYDFKDAKIAEVDDTIIEFLSTKTNDEQNQSFELPETIPVGQRNATLYRLACSLQAKGLSDEVIKMTVMAEGKTRCAEPLTAKDEKELEKTIESALKKNKGQLKIVQFNQPNQTRQKKFIQLETYTDKSGIEHVVQSTMNMVTVMEQDERLAGKIAYNELSFSPFVRGNLPWTDSEEYREWNNFDDSNIKAWIESEYGLKSSEKCMDALNIVMNRHRFNPVVDWLETLGWDKKPRIEQLLQTYLGVEDNIYTRECMKIFMLGAISRAYHAGTKFDYMPVLVGEQGVGKSTFFRMLACNNGWYDDNFNTIEGDKACERLRGMWIVEMAELLATKRAKEVEGIKAFITSTTDSYRPPYGRRTEQRPRMCVFGGTTNSNHFLTDKTGNRRFLPLKVNKKHVKKSLFDNLEDVGNDFIQAWAEAMQIYRKGDFSLILSKDAQEIADKMQGRYVEDDYRIGMIQDYLDQLSSECKYVCVAQLWEKALDCSGSKLDRRTGNEIHDIMCHSIDGWRRVENASNGRCRTQGYGVQICYERIPNDTKEDFIMVSDSEPLPFD